MTRTVITATLAALVASASIATAGSSSFISNDGVQEDRSYVEFNTVTSASDAVLEVRDFRLGSVGELLGTAPIHAGANSNVKVRIGADPLGDVIAVIKSGDQVLATQEVEIDVN